MFAVSRTGRGILFLVLLSLALSLPATAHAQTLFSKSKSENKTGGKGESQGPMTREELQFAVMAFADSFAARVHEAATALENQATTPSARLVASRMKVYPLFSVLGIASGPHPGPAVLDLLVLTTLTRMVWEEYWRPEVFGSPADAMVTVLGKLEEEIWSLAGKLLTPEQQGELRDLIQQWHDQNPEKKYVNYIRFSDFGPLLGRKPHLKEITKPGGLLAPVTEAAQQVEEMRMTAERFMYLLSRLILITGYQAELIYQELVNKPEVQELLSETAGFREISERYADLMAKLPVQMAEVGTGTVNQAVKSFSVQSEAMINQIAQNLSTEREAAIAQALRGVSQERDMMIEQLMRGLAVERSAALTQALQGISQEREEILREVARLMIRSETVAERWMSQAFFLGLAFILVILLAMLVYRFATKGPFGFRGMTATTAVFLAILATMAYWKYGLQAQSPFQDLEFSHRSGQDSGNLAITDRSADPSGENRASLKTSDEGQRGDRFASDDVTARAPDWSSKYGNIESVGKVETEQALRSEVEDKLLQTKSGPREEKPSHQCSADRGPEASAESDKTRVERNLIPESYTALSAYTIHLESWRRFKTASKRVRHLESIGLEAWQGRVELPVKGTYYRVYVGRFPSISKAKNFQARLEQDYDLGKGVIMSAPAVKN